MNKSGSGQARSILRLAISLGVPLALAVASHAAELTGSFTGGVGHSNNIARSSAVSIDEEMAVVGMDLTYSEDTARFSSSAQLNANYVTYLDDTFDAEVLGGGALDANYFFVEEVFSWSLLYNWGQQVFDPLRPVSPGNREDVHYITTGPSLNLALGTRFFFGADAKWSAVIYEERPNDNDRLTAQVQLGRYLSSESSLALVASTERIMFEDDVTNPDFDRNELFMRYATNIGRNSMSLDVGYNEVEFAGTDEVGDGLVVRLDWTRTISEFSTLSVGGGTRYSDQGDIFRLSQAINPNFGETEDVVGSPSPFQNDFANVRYTLVKPRFTFDMFLTWSDEAYIDTPEADRRMLRSGFSVSRAVSRKITGRAGFTYNSREFTSTGRTDDDISYNLSIGYEFNPAVNAALDYQHFRRGSDAPQDEFDEDRIFLMFTYVPKWGR